MDFPSPMHALDFVKSKRRSASPNTGFLKQLQFYQRKLQDPSFTVNWEEHFMKESAPQIERWKGGVKIN
jgi:hypothetical protein